MGNSVAHPFPSVAKTLLIYVLLIALLLIFPLTSGCTSSPTESPTPASTPSLDVSVPCPELIFRDPEFAFELRRTLSATYSGEADLGECLYTASRITDGDFESWHREWYAMAEHFKNAGDQSLAQGHNVSARDSYYRAATYYRTAEFFLH